MPHSRLYLYFAIVSVFGPFSLASSASAQTATTTPVFSLDIPRVTTAPRLEDYLSDGSAPGLAVSDFRQRSPHDLEPATEKTTAYLSYDAANLYVAFVCQIADRSQLRARMARRESVFSDDLVGIYLDTFFSSPANGRCARSSTTTRLRRMPRWLRSIAAATSGPTCF